MRLTTRFLVLALAVTAVHALAAPARGFHHDPLPAPEPPFVVCEHQRYALCATAQCFVYGGVAYCRCDVEWGDSISLQLSYQSPTGERDVCDVNRQGRLNGRSSRPGSEAIVLRIPGRTIGPTR
jgi:hypothetical protein